MDHKLVNDELSITVNNLGAELQSITSVHSGENYLWHGDSRIWDGRSPLLFPIVGALKDSLLKHNGSNYTLPRHGLARRAQFNTTICDEHTIELELCSNSTTLNVFPWQFTLTVRYSLSGNRINIEYQVQSLDNNPMTFAIGAHPAFSLPLDSVSFESFAITFDNDISLTRFNLNDEGLLASSGAPYTLKNRQILLSPTLFADDALVFKNIESTCISLRQNGKDRVRVHTGGAPHLGIWAKPGAAFVCIEPWHGYSDAENASGQWADKPSLLSLDKDEIFSHQWGIEIVR